MKHVNDHVESFRQKEWLAVRPSKRTEFDSHNFSHLRDAAIVIAAANGFEESIPDFRKGYKIQLDRATPKANKAKKKKVFRRPAVDAEIARLKREVFKIIDEGSFKMSCVGRDDEVHRRVTKILLLVQMAVLRYLGYRQQCLRACRVGEHVFFNSDGSIRFEFPKEVTKNRKHIRITLSPGEHGATHGELLEILWKYYNDVYPYITGRNAGVHGHLFVTVSPQTGKFRRYKHGEEFGMSFVGWGNVHLRYENFPGAQEQNLNLNPHFFRGLCVDWEDAAARTLVRARLVERLFRGVERHGVLGGSLPKAPHLAATPAPLAAPVGDHVDDRALEGGGALLRVVEEEGQLAADPRDLLEGGAGVRPLEEE